MTTAYNYLVSVDEEPPTYAVDFFSLQYRSDTNKLESFSKLLLTGQVSCVAINQVSATQAYALLTDPYSNNSLTLFNLDFSGRTYTTKVSGTSSYTRANVTARFVANDSAEFYYSSLSQLAGLAYQYPQGYVATSLTSRRNNALLSSSWSGATSFAAAEGTEVF